MGWTLVVDWTIWKIYQWSPHRNTECRGRRIEIILVKSPTLISMERIMRSCCGSSIFTEFAWTTDLMKSGLQ